MNRLWMALDGMVMFHMSNVFCKTKLWECHEFLWRQLSQETYIHFGWCAIDSNSEPLWSKWLHSQIQYLYPCHPRGYATCSWSNFEILSVSNMVDLSCNLRGSFWNLVWPAWNRKPRTSNDHHKIPQATQSACYGLPIQLQNNTNNNARCILMHLDASWCILMLHQILPRQQEVIRAP